MAIAFAGNTSGTAQRTSPTSHRKKLPEGNFFRSFCIAKASKSRIASERSRLEVHSFRQKRQYERIKILVFLFEDGIIILRRFMAIKSSDY